MKTKSVIKKTTLIPTALIAGGAGFVGSHLCEALLNKGARVIVVDNFRTGKQSYVNHLLSNPNFAMFDCDINERLPEDIESVDYIFHLAGLEEYSYTKEVIDLSSLMTNAFGTKNLLDLARSSEAKFLLLSTTDVYEGRMSQLELSDYFGRNKIEESRYMVAEAKRYAEALVWEYYKKNETDVRIVRVPEVYGPRMNLLSSGNLGRFLSDIISGRDLTIYGEGSEKEFYLYIEDAISGILKSMYNDKTKGNIYSLVPEEPVTVLELAYMVKGVADAGVRVKFEDAQPEGYFKSGNLRIPDSFNLQELRWEAKVSLKDGVMKSLESFSYSPNPYSFKPTRLIEQKINEMQTPDEKLFSLQDVKEPAKQPVIIPVLLEAGPKGPNFAPQPPKIVLPTLNLPRIQLPKIPLPNIHIPFPKISSGLSMRLLIIFSVLFSLTVISIGVPSLKAYISLKTASTNLQLAVDSAKQLHTNDVMQEAKTAYDNFYKTKSALVALRPFFVLTGKGSNYKSYDNLLSSLTYLSKGIYLGAKGAVPLENLWQVIRPDTAETINASAFADAKIQLEAAKNSLLMAEGDFKYVDRSVIPQKYQTFYDNYAAGLDTLQKSLDAAVPVFSSLPELLGSLQTRKYLILFQNSNELRATGGFIGSYGVLTVEKGKIKDLTIDDVYNPDGQIDQRNIISDVPKPIADLLQEKRLHIRNANWDPDFTTSANTIEDLYFKVTGERVDGVIAVDLYFIQNLLKATGPIFLTAYNEEVNATNVYERAELHSEFNYKDGSDQKRSFLTVLGSKLLERLFSLDRAQLPSLATATLDSLNQRHMLVYFTNDPINELLKIYHWDGALVNTWGDYLNVVDSNLGGTKANYYVNESMNYQISSLTRDGVLRATLQIAYEHTGQDTAWPGGPYTDYVRVLTQNGAKLTGASIKYDDKEAQGIFDKVITAQEDRYTSFETSFVLAPKSKILLTLNYDLSPQLALTKANSTYQLYWQKQSGTQNNTFYFSFPKPFGFSVADASTNIKQSPDKLEMSGTLTDDASLYVKLQ